MAWDWGGAGGGALSGAATGAGIGSIIPGIGTALGAGVGALAGGLFGGFQSPTTAVGGPQDITNVNQYTDPFYQQMMGYGSNAYNQLMSSLGGGNPYYAGMQDFMSNLDPNAAYNYFSNNMAGGLRDMAEQNYAAYNTANQAVADRLSNQAVQNISSQFANRGPGALRSGGAMQAISEGAINPLLQSNAQIANMIGGQAGALQGQGMQNAYAAQNAANQLGMSGWLGLMGSADQRAMADQNLLGNMWGTSMGLAGGIADPWLYQQQYMNNPNYISMANGMNAASDVFGPMI